MGATFQVISCRIGEDGRKSGIQLLRVQQLLARVLLLRRSDVSGSWSAATRQAILDFKEFFQVPEKERTACFEPDDPYRLILNLCKSAGVLLPVPADKCGAAAFLEFFDTACSLKIPYAWAKLGGKDRIAYGLHGHPGYVVFTNVRSQFEVDDDSPIAMNCTSFTNLALSIWCTGKAHAHPYNPSQDVGGFNPVGTRYDLKFVPNKRSEEIDFGFSLAPKAKAPASHGVVNLPSPLDPENYRYYFYSAKEVLAAVDPGRLYYLQWCYLKDTRKRNAVMPSGFGHHDTVLYGGDVFEINIRRPYLRRTPLQKRFDSSEAVRVMGPL